MKEKRFPFSALRRTAGEVRRYRTYRRIIPIAIGVILALLSLLYVLSLLFGRQGSFTVRAQDAADRRYALSLSEDENFLYATSHLQAQEARDITNIDGNTLPTNLNDVSGAHNGDNYVAYTFYVRNSGEEVCTYQWALYINRRTAGIDAAARVRLYLEPFFYRAESGEHIYSNAYTDYAKPKTGGGGAPEIDPTNRVMTNFESEGVVASGKVSDFAPGDITKVTVVIWLEGWDPDCNDNVLGGQLGLDMTFDTVGGDN